MTSATSGSYRACKPGADLAGGGQDPKEIPTRRWSERVSEASRILPEHRGASLSAAWRPGELLIDSEEDRVLRAVLVGMLRERRPGFLRVERKGVSRLPATNP